ncbi:hypothetical protein [Azospirillum sp. sgz301742]
MNTINIHDPDVQQYLTLVLGKQVVPFLLGVEQGGGLSHHIQDMFLEDIQGWNFNDPNLWDGMEPLRERMRTLTMDAAVSAWVGADHHNAALMMVRVWVRNLWSYWNDNAVCDIYGFNLKAIGVLGIMACDDVAAWHNLFRELSGYEEA